jgi:hypothetical protein
MTHFSEAREADSHMILVRLLVQDMILLGQGMVHQAYGGALDSQVAEAAALVEIHSEAMAAMILFELAYGNVNTWMGNMERALCIAGATTKRKPGIHNGFCCEMVLPDCLPGMSLVAYEKLSRKALILSHIRSAEK